MVEDSARLSRTEVLDTLGVADDFLLQLERAGIVRADTEGFEIRAVERIRLCRTLRHDLGVNHEGMEVALHLLDLIRNERRQFQDVLLWLRENLR